MEVLWGGLTGKDGRDMLADRPLEVMDPIDADGDAAMLDGLGDKLVDERINKLVDELLGENAAGLSPGNTARKLATSNESVSSHWSAPLSETSWSKLYNVPSQKYQPSYKAPPDERSAHDMAPLVVSVIAQVIGLYAVNGLALSTSTSATPLTVMRLPTGPLSVEAPAGMAQPEV